MSDKPNATKTIESMNVVVMDAIVTTHSAHVEKATETKAHYENMVSKVDSSHVPRKGEEQ